MKPLKHVVILTLLIILNQSIFAQVSKDAAVQIEVTIGNNPPNLHLHWPADANATSILLYRRVKAATSWGSAKKLAATATDYLDTTVVKGTIYEYRILKNLTVGTTAITAYGYTESGIEVPPVITRGKLILLIDQTFSDSLKPELSRLVQDLWNDGWNVIRHDVSRTDSVPDVKNIIINDYSDDPNNTKALFIFGHVPVPYSGFIHPDGHPNHLGAWPADVYYGEFNYGDWPDQLTDTSSGILPANHNIAGDGKFDVSTLSQISSTVDLMIGRVDLSDMPSFKLSEKDLLKQYLNKDHAFRTGTLTAPKRALLEDSFGYFGGEAFAASGWRSLAPLVGIDSIKQLQGTTDSARTYQWLHTLTNIPYLWAYGCGGGWFQGAGGAGSAGEYAQYSPEAIFTMLFGSYFGDWNVTDNFLRSPLCTSYGLSCSWSGRPYWMYFPMGLGEPIGYCAWLTQNNTTQYATPATGITNWVHIALMGDPTLVMNPYVPPTALSVTTSPPNNTATLSWQPSTDKNILGYNIYRSNSPTGSYQLITPNPISGTTYTDRSPLVDTNAYTVRAIKLETTPSGSYYNLSSGARGYITGLITNGVTAASSGSDNLQTIQMANGIEIILSKSATSATKLDIYDGSGRIIHSLDNRTLSAGEYRYDWQTSSIASGVYFVRAIGGKEPLVAKILVVN